MTTRPDALVVVSSSCQLYSGTGTALFDWMRHARDAINFSLLVDTGQQVNFNIAARFCRDMGIMLISGEPEQVPGCPDLRSANLAQQLASRRWDIIECVSWANAATNMEVLANQPTGSRLIFTPHSQPVWTLHGHDRYFMVPPIFERMLAASDLVLIDTPVEISHMPRAASRLDRCVHIPLGVDTGRFCPASGRIPRSPPRLLAVADFREHRKRPDLLLRVLDAALAARPGLVAVLAGRDSDRLRLPPHMVARSEQLGYVSADELLRQYQSARVLLSLSDFEAFGLPVAEALCCGTPVVIHDQPEPVSVFGDLPGVSVVHNTDLAAARDAVLAHAAAPPNRVAIARAAADRFGLAATYGRKLAHVHALLEAHMPAAVC